MRIIPPSLLIMAAEARCVGAVPLCLMGNPLYLVSRAVKEGDADITIEPLKGFPVVRDLIVDKSKVMDKLKTVEVRQDTGLVYEDIVATMDPAVYAKIEALQWCAKCLSCVSVCPIINTMKDLEKYSGPATMVAIGLRFYDPNDEADRVLQAVNEGLFECSMCGLCSQVCPSNIDHLSVFSDLRAAAEERGLKPKVS